MKTAYIERPALTHEEVADIANLVLKNHFDLKMRPTQETRLIRAAIIAGIEVALAKQGVKGGEA